MEKQALINQLLEEFLGMEPGSVHGELRLVEDLGADSLDCVEIAMMLEDEFDVEIYDDVMERVVTVKELYDLV